MDFKKKLNIFKKEIDREIGLFLDGVIKETAESDKIVAEALMLAKKNILAGGKRIRPALMYFGYIGAGGKKKEEILKTSVGIELIHSFLLIHDDVIDRDIMRHGRDTLNHAYENKGRFVFKDKTPDHFGNSMAIIIGDAVAALGNQVIFDSDFEPKLVLRALSKLQDIINLTVIGQTKDMCLKYKKSVSEEDVLQMYEYKTAKYTLEGPLHLGGILGGASDKIIAAYSQFAIPLGIAFQIQDDILGIFGSEKKTGKSVGSDIKEEKTTILTVKAIELGNASDKKRLKEIMKKSEIEECDIEEFRNILVKTGALDYANQKAQNLIDRGRKAIEKAPIEKNSRDFLVDLASHMVERSC